MFKNHKLNILLNKEKKKFNKSLKKRLNIFNCIRKGENNLILKTAFENNYLICFNFKKDFYKKTKKEKIFKLKELLKVSIKNNQSYLKRRLKTHPINKVCWVCKINNAYYQHHIIQIKNGGCDNGINRIPICDECHLDVHDWMKIKKMQEEIDCEYNLALLKD